MKFKLAAVLGAYPCYDVLWHACRAKQAYIGRQSLTCTCLLLFAADPDSRGEDGLLRSGHGVHILLYYFDDAMRPAQLSQADLFGTTVADLDVMVDTVQSQQPYSLQVRFATCLPAQVEACSVCVMRRPFRYDPGLPFELPAA